jgi:hypothetical protein
MQRSPRDSGSIVSGSGSIASTVTTTSRFARRSALRTLRADLTAGAEHAAQTPVAFHVLGQVAEGAPQKRQFDFERLRAMVFSRLV